MIINTGEESRVPGNAVLADRDMLPTPSATPPRQLLHLDLVKIGYFLHDGVPGLFASRTKAGGGMCGGQGGWTHCWLPSCVGPQSLSSRSTDVLTGEAGARLPVWMAFCSLGERLDPPGQSAPETAGWDWKETGDRPGREAVAVSLLPELAGAECASWRKIITQSYNGAWPPSPPSTCPLSPRPPQADWSVFPSSAAGSFSVPQFHLCCLLPESPFFPKVGSLGQRLPFPPGVGES